MYARTALEGYYNGDPYRAVRAAKLLLLAAAGKTSLYMCLLAAGLSDGLEHTLPLVVGHFPDFRFCASPTY
jgi:hypothetical protein